MKTPWHLWLVGVVTLLWNLVGAFDFIMTVTKSEPYLNSFTPEQLEYFKAFPLWMLICWGVAVFGSVLGSIFLLMRSWRAVWAFGVSLFGMVGTSLYSFVLAETSVFDIMGPGALWFSLLIIVITIALYLYARAMRRAGVLG